MTGIRTNLRGLCFWLPAGGGVVCVCCGAWRSVPLLRPCEAKPATQRAKRLCDHLGPAVLFRDASRRGQPVTIEVTCNTCDATPQRVPQAVYQCAEFGRCLPGYAPTGDVLAEYLQRPDRLPLCQGCERRATA